MGLFGNMLVDSPDRDYYSPVNREQTLVLDDLLVNADTLIPFGKEAPDYALMGRVGNVLLVNGEPRYALDARRRARSCASFSRTSRARARTTSRSAARRSKSSRRDVSRFEREERVPSVVLAPAERYVVEVRFDKPGAVRDRERDPGDQPLRRRVRAGGRHARHRHRVDRAPATPDYAQAVRDAARERRRVARHRRSIASTSTRRRTRR